MKGCPMIKQNEGLVDRIIRVVVGGIALFAGAFWFSGVLQTVLYVVGVAALITGAVGFCGLYTLFGFTTKRDHTK